MTIMERMTCNTRSAWIKVGYALLILFIYLLFLSTAAAENDLVIYFIDVGQADAAIITYGDMAMMIDGGNVADSSLIYCWQRKSIWTSGRGKTKQIAGCRCDYF